MYKTAPHYIGTRIIWQVVINTEQAEHKVAFFVRSAPAAGIAVIFTWLASRFNYDRTAQSSCDFICSLTRDVSMLSAHRRTRAPLFGFINGQRHGHVWRLGLLEIRCEGERRRRGWWRYEFYEKSPWGSWGNKNKPGVRGEGVEGSNFAF